MRDILAWALAVEALGLAAAPILRLFFGNRRDSALLSRPIGLALVAYVSWAATLLPRIPFDRRLIFFALLAVAGVSYAIDRRTRPRRKDSPFWGPEDKRAAIYFWASTAVFLVIRAAVPEILGAEKFMDLAFLNSIARHGAMPPLDPWMAGKTINYYYWGYLLAATLTKLASVTPFVSYNLAVATFAGYSFCGAASLGARLSDGRRGTAIAAGAAAVFAGNLQGAIDAVKAPFDKGFDYWHASRVIAEGDTINEFPFFTFFHADLHPHLLAFPYFLAVFVIAHRLCEPEAAAGKSRWERALPYLFAAFSAGTAVAANAWNLPAIAIALVFACTARAVGSGPLWRPAALARGAMAGAATLIGGLLLFRPYARTYSLPYNGLGWTTQKSGIFELMGVWGLFFAVAAAALWPPRASEEAARRRTDLLLSASAGAGLLAAFFFRKPALLPLLFLAILGLTAAIRGTRAGQAAADRTVFTLFLLLLSLGMIAGCEFVYFKDSYGDKLQRMNTIFKFYHQAWPLLAVAVVVLAGAAWRAAGARGAVLRALGVTAAALALFYPINATASRLRQREGAFSLDAMPALARRNAGDAAAIAWLEANAAARSVVLEATGDPYREFARISSHTGLPTVMGWANHEGLWRSNDPEVAVRAQLVRGFYSTADEETALEIVKKFDIRYVILGDLERATHPNADHISGFLFLEPVSKGSTTVYKVRGAS
jgi:YYY domain-containing protein